MFFKTNIQKVTGDSNETKQKCKKLIELYLFNWDWIWSLGGWERRKKSFLEVHHTYLVFKNYFQALFFSSFILDLVWGKAHLLLNCLFYYFVCGVFWNLMGCPPILKWPHVGKQTPISHQFKDNDVLRFSGNHSHLPVCVIFDPLKDSNLVGFRPWTFSPRSPGMFLNTCSAETNMFLLVNYQLFWMF